MPAVALPPIIEDKLAHLAAGVRRMRLLRGVSWLALVLFLIPIAVVALDASLELSGWTRGILLGGWLIVGGLSAWWFVWRRWNQPVPAAQLSAAIEEKYPSLAERLRTLVELSEHADAGNGSATMIALLARETDRRASKMNFFSAAPTTYSLRFGAVSLLVVLLALSPIFVLSGGGDRVRRFLLPWHVPTVEVTHRVVVSSGDPVVRRGEPVTLSAYMEKTKLGAGLPDSAALVYREVGGHDEKKLPMTGDAAAAFTVTRPRTTTDFEYCVEAGGVRSEWHTVSTVDPVKLVDGTTVTIRPPAYAEGRIAPVTQQGLGELNALQYSVATFTFTFDRPPTDVHLEWRPRDARPDQPAVAIPHRLASNGLSTSADFTMPANGTLKLVLFGDRVRTEMPVAVHIIPDAAPRFDRVVGMPEQSREVRPDAVLMLDLAISDDVSVASAEIEYLRDGQVETAVKREALPLTGLGTAKAAGQVRFTLAGKAKVDETLRVRIRMTDGRKIPGIFPTPHEVTYPEAGWAQLRLSTTARPMTEQDILAKKQSIADKLDGARQLVADAIQDLTTLRPAVNGQPTLAADQSVRLADDKEKTIAAARKLQAVAAEADAVPELASLATATRRIADGSLREAQAKQQAASIETQATTRDDALTEAQKRLESALTKIDELRKQNEAIARARLEKDQLDRLAESQENLASDAKKPDARPADLTVRQKELSDELAKLTKESDTLRQANESADQARLGEVADRLKRLAELQTELNEAAKKTGSGAQKDRLDQLARRQAELNRQAAELAKKTDAAARVAGTPPLTRKPFEQSDQLIGEQKPLDALAEQEKAARDLDRLADALGKAATARGDAKEAARQIANWQEDLRRRAADANPELRSKLATEEASIRAAIDRLSLPATPALEKLRTEASTQAKTASERMGDDATAADAAMKKVVQALGTLAKDLPTNAQRWKATIEVLDKLQREQEQVARTTTDTTKTAETADKQDDIAGKLRTLDTPGLTDRRDRAAASATRAATDIRANKPQDIAASQQATKRQIGWLREALEGQTPADTRAAELAGLQNTISELLDRVAVAKPDELQRLQRMQSDLRQKLERLASPDLGKDAQDARDAANALEAALRKPDPNVDELRKKAKTSTEALDRLTDRLGGPDAKPEEKTAEPADAESLLPTAQAAQAARDLARQQRDLRDQLARAAEANAKPQPPTGKDPLADLVKEQAEIAAKADELAKKARRLTAADAASSAAAARVDAQNAAEQLRAGDPSSATQAGEQAAKALRAAAQAAAGKPELQRALEELTKRQTDLTRQAGDVGNAESVTRQRNRQEEIAQQAAELADAIAKEPANDTLQKAAAAVQAAAKQMEAAAKEAKAGRASAADTARQDAARDLGTAANTARQAAGPVGVPADPNAQAAAAAAKEAAGHMAKARNQLGSGTGAGATESMNQAADALKRAAKGLAPGSGGGGGGAIDPAQPDEKGDGRGAGAGKLPDTISGVRLDTLGKAWGDLPGEVKSRVTQELRARYGEEYARVISLYFEQTAKRK